MEKEKMVQEMVNDLEHCGVDNDCDSCVKKNYPCYIYDWCKTLAEKGYRKMSECSVLLTEEEQNKILKATEKRIDQLKKQVELTRKETAKTFANALKKVFIEQRNRFDKIVAQEQKTYKYLRDEDDKAHIKQIEDNANGQALMADKSIGYINKLLKEDFGVEVEE